MTQIDVRLTAAAQIKVEPPRATKSFVDNAPVQMPWAISAADSSERLYLRVSFADVAALRRLRDAIDTALTEHGDQT